MKLDRRGDQRNDHDIQMDHGQCLGAAWRGGAEEFPIGHQDIKDDTCQHDVSSAAPLMAILKRSERDLVTPICTPFLEI